MIKKVKSKNNLAELILNNSYCLSYTEKKHLIDQLGKDYTTLSDQEFIEIALKTKFSFSNTLLLILNKRFQDFGSTSQNKTNFLKFIKNLNQSEIENIHALFQQYYFNDINLYIPVEKMRYQLKLFITNESALNYFPSYYDISLLKYDLSEIISEINNLITTDKQINNTNHYFSNTHKLMDVVIKRKGLLNNKKLNQKNIGKSIDSEKDKGSIYHAFLFDEKSSTIAKVFEYGKNHYFITPEQILYFQKQTGIDSFTTLSLILKSLWCKWIADKINWFDTKTSLKLDEALLFKQHDLEFYNNEFKQHCSDNIELMIAIFNQNKGKKKSFFNLETYSTLDKNKVLDELFTCMKENFQEETKNITKDSFRCLLLELIFNNIHLMSIDSLDSLIYKEFTKLLLGKGCEIKLAHPTNLFMVPFLRNENFCGREKELDEINQLFFSDKEQIKPVAISGLAGIGKTQLVIEYSYKEKSLFSDGIFWINAANDLFDEIFRLAEYLGFVNEFENTITQTYKELCVKKVFQYLQTNTKILLIIDNIEDPVFIRKNLIKNDNNTNLSRLNVAKLLTTRTKNIDSGFNKLDLKALTEDTALNLFINKSERSDLLDIDNPDRQTAKLICRFLGYLPLAIVIAASYLREYSDITLIDYLERIKKEKERLHFLSKNIDLANLSIPETDKEDFNVIINFNESWNILTKKESRELLMLSSLFEEAKLIPDILLSIGINVNYEHEPGEPSEFDNLIRHLNNFSLVEEIKEDKIRLHPLIRDFARTKIDDEKNFVEKVLKRYAKKFEDVLFLEYLISNVGFYDTLQYLADIIKLSLDNTESKLSLLNLYNLLIKESYNITRPFSVSSKSNHKKANDKTILQALMNIGCEHNYDFLKNHSKELLKTKSGKYIELKEQVGATDPALISTFYGHKNNVYAVDLNDKYIVSGSSDNTLMVWDIETGIHITTLTGHKSDIFNLFINENKLISVDGLGEVKIWSIDSFDELNSFNSNQAPVTFSGSNKHYIITSSIDGTIKLWDINTYEYVKTLQANPAPVFRVEMTEKHILSSSGDSCLRLWDIETGRELYCHHVPDQVILTIAINDKYIIYSTEERDIVVLDRLTFKEVRVLSGHTYVIYGMKIIDHYLVTSAMDNTIKIWDLEKGIELRTLVGHLNWVTGIAVNNKYIVSGSWDNTVKLWKFEPTKNPKTISAQNESLFCLNIIEDKLYTGSITGKVQIWDTKTKQLLKTIKPHDETIWSIEQYQDKIMTGSLDGYIKIFDKNFETEIKSIKAHNKGILNLIVSKNHLATSSEDKTVKVWDIEKAQCVKTLTGHKAWIHGLDIFNDFAVTGSWDFSVKLWSLKSGKELISFNEHMYYVLTAIFFEDKDNILGNIDDKDIIIPDNIDPDEIEEFKKLKNLYIITGAGDKTVKVYSIATGKSVRTLVGEQNSIFGLCLNNNELFSSTLDSLIKAWDLKTGENTKTFTGHLYNIRQIKVYNDTLYSCAFDGVVKTWDTEKVKEINTFTGNNYFENKDYIVYVEESIDLKIINKENNEETIIKNAHKEAIYAIDLYDDYLVSGSKDSTVSIWNITTGKLVYSLDYHLDAICCVNISEKYLITASSDRVIHVCHPKTYELLATYCSYFPVKKINIISDDEIEVVDDRLIPNFYRLKIVDN